MRSNKIFYVSFVPVLFPSTSDVCRLNKPVQAICILHTSMMVLQEAVRSKSAILIGPGRITTAGASRTSRTGRSNVLGECRDLIS